MLAKSGCYIVVPRPWLVITIDYQGGASVGSAGVAVGTSVGVAVGAGVLVGG